MNNFHTRNKTRAPPAQEGCARPAESVPEGRATTQKHIPYTIKGFPAAVQAAFPILPPALTPLSLPHPRRCPVQVRWLPPSFSIKLTAPPPASTGDPGSSCPQRRFPHLYRQRLPTVHFLVAALHYPWLFPILAYLFPTSRHLTSFFSAR